MERVLLILIGISVLGFVIGLAGRARSVTKNAIKRNIFYQRLLLISTVLMFLFAIAYKFLV